jgi:hypothetical protein
LHHLKSRKAPEILEKASKVFWKPENFQEKFQKNKITKFWKFFLTFRIFWNIFESFLKFFQRFYRVIKDPEAPKSQEKISEFQKNLKMIQKTLKNSKIQGI